MVVLFIIGLLLCVCMLYCPGFIFLKLFGRSSKTSLLIAPLMSVTIYALLAIVYQLIGISSNWINNILIPFLVLVVCILLKRAIRKSLGNVSIKIKLKIPDMKTIVLYCSCYLAAPVMIAFYAYIFNLDGLDSFIQQIDMWAHIDRIYCDTLSGNWSSLISGYDRYSNDEAVYAPFGIDVDYEHPTSFYPSAFLLIPVALCDLLPIKAPLALNIATFLFVSFVYPSGMFAFLSRLFPGRRSIVLCGGLCSMLFGMFPWCILCVGLVPYCASLCLLPAFLSLFYDLVKCKVRTYDFFALGTLTVVGFLGIALTHSSIIFTSLMFIIPLCTYKAMRSKRVSQSKHKKLYAFSVILVSVIVTILLWLILFNTPFLQSVIWSNNWKSYLSLKQTIVNTFDLSFVIGNAQLLLSVLVMVGVLYFLSLEPKRWILIPYLLAVIIFIAGTTSSGKIQTFLTGFWYTDYNRLAANVSFYAIPLASAGMSIIANQISKFIAIGSLRYKGFRQDGQKSVCVVLVAIMSMFILLPNYSLYGYGEIGTSFGKVKDTFRAFQSFDREESVLSNSEQEFLNKVALTIGTDELVVNIPIDGSILAKEQVGLKTYYRYMYMNPDEDTEMSELIRKHLSELSFNNDVAQAVDSLGVEYVLQLDQGNMTSPYIYNLKTDDWSGISSITDETPGFEIVLSEGDMRLYKITGTK